MMKTKNVLEGVRIMNMNEKVSFNTTEKNIDRLKALSTENAMPIGRFLNQQLENYFNENNLVETNEVKFDKSLSVANLSPKAKVALDHLYKEMFDKIIGSNPSKDEGYVITYFDLDTDKERLLSFDSKKEAEDKFKEIRKNKNYISEFLMTRSQYDQFQLDVIIMGESDEGEF